MTELVIFDLDGTLLNTIEDLGNACNHALEMCGHPVHDMKEYNMLVGRGIYNLFRGALPEGHRTDTEVRRMKDFFIPWYDAHKCDRTRPYDGMPALLGTLEARGIKLGVASNKYQDGTEKLVRHFFPDLDFVRILGQREGMPIKPDPGIVREIEKAYGHTGPGEVIYSGDSDVDMETGKNAGVITAGVTWGFRSREELSSRHPDMLCDTPEELARAIIGQDQDPGRI